jgi:ribosomal protein L7/L12
MILLWIALGLVGLFVAAFVLASLRDASARRSGFLPAEGQATMADVERLAKAGQRIYAIRCYREIHRCGLAEAKKALDDLYPAT